MSEQQLALETIQPATELTFPIITVPSTQALLTKVELDIEDAKVLVVDSEEMVPIMQDIVGRLSTVRDAMDAERLSATKPLRDAVGTINGGYNPAIEMIDRAIAAGKARMVEWNRHVKAERERIAREQEVSRRKEAADAQAKRAQAEAEAQKLVDEAKVANEVGDIDTAAELMARAQVTVDTARVAEQAANMVVPSLAGPVAVKGAITTWKAKCTSKRVLIQTIAEMIGKGDFSYENLLDVNETNLNALARVQKDSGRLAGVEFYTEDNIRAGRRAV